MEFTKQAVIELIELYRQKKLLWDPKSPNYYHKVRKEDAWQEIAHEMNRSVDQCKKKMEYLLAGLRREKMKMKKRISNGEDTEGNYRSTWFAFEAMRFIWDKNSQKRRPVIRKVANEQTSKPLESRMISSLVALQDKKPDLGSGSSQCSQQLPPPKMLKTEMDQYHNEAFEMLTVSARQRNDESHHFGNFVASKLRNYDMNTRHAIQSDIMNIFMRANRGYYNNFNNYTDNAFQGPFTDHPNHPPTCSRSPKHSSPTTSTPEAQTPLPSPNNSMCDDFTIQDFV